MDPIDVIANAIRVADGNHTMGAGQLAEVVVLALADERIVTCAAARLQAEEPGMSHLDALATARAVLCSVRGA